MIWRNGVKATRVAHNHKKQVRVLFPQHLTNLKGGYSIR